MLQHSKYEKLGCRALVVTPENIAFEYALAGPFQRLPALVLDFVLRWVVFISLMMAIGLVLGWLGFLAPVEDLLGFLMLVSFFLMSWFYGIFFETYFNGRTPGKMLMKLRAISVDGRPINGVQAGLRNLLRMADCQLMISLQLIDSEFPPAYIIPTLSVGLFTMLLTTRMQRVGDLAAGTMVVSEAHRPIATRIQPDDLRAFGLADLIPANYVVGSSLARALGQYMENRKRLNSLRREEVAGHVAKPLIAKFQLLPDTSSDLLLCALYVRTFFSQQQQDDGLTAMRASQLRVNLPSVPIDNGVSTT
jgi:uncharacterized RDD family membrane protein YckC